MNNLKFKGNTEIGRKLYELGGDYKLTVNPSSLGDEGGDMLEVNPDALIEMMQAKVVDKMRLIQAQEIIWRIIQEENLADRKYCGYRLGDYQTNRILGGVWHNPTRFLYECYDSAISESEWTHFKSKYFTDPDAVYHAIFHSGFFDMSASFLLEMVGMESRRQDGRFSKRVSTAYRKLFGLKLPEELVTEAGNCYNNCRIVDKEFTISVTNNFGWDPDDEDTVFGNSSSCWWGCYGPSRDTLYTYGGYGILFWDGDNLQHGYGRAWIYPIDDDTAIVFNSYGNELVVSSAVVAKLLEKLTGRHFTYGKRDVKNTARYGSEYPYINGTNGHNNEGGATCYVVYSGEHKPGKVIEIDMERNLGIFTGKCARCGSYFSVSPDEGGVLVYEENGNSYCEVCLRKISSDYHECEHCGDRLSNEEYENNVFEDHDGHYCNRHFQNFSEGHCEICNGSFWNGSRLRAYVAGDGSRGNICINCLAANAISAHPCAAHGWHLSAECQICGNE